MKDKDSTYLCYTYICKKKEYANLQGAPFDKQLLASLKEHLALDPFDF